MKNMKTRYRIMSRGNRGGSLYCVDARFKVERLAATRQFRLCRRLASLPAGRGQRAMVI